MVITSDGAPDDRKLALFIDMDNVVIGVRDAGYEKFDIELVLARLVEKGDIIVKKAYADWSNHQPYKRPLHEAAIELIDIPESRRTGKNSADIKMVVDAMELSYTKAHIDSFVLISGDSDFSPLVSKLRENGKYIIGLGVKNSSARLLIDNCDEMSYDDLVRTRRPRRAGGRAKGLSQRSRRPALLMETPRRCATTRGALVARKETMKRKNPGFNEEYHGYRSFNRLLEDAQKQKLIAIHKDARSGTYVIDEVLEEAG
jgi:uncharacterized protein (TIGR00288 family)